MYFLAIQFAKLDADNVKKYYKEKLAALGQLDSLPR